MSARAGWLGQRTNQSSWRGVVASWGGESRNGGHGPGERDWGRSAVRGGPAVWQPVRRFAGPHPVWRRGVRPALLVSEGDRARPGEQQVPLGGPRGKARTPAGPPLAHRAGSRGRWGAAPPAADRRRPGEPSAPAGLFLSSPPRPNLSGVARSPLGDLEGPASMRGPPECPARDLALPPALSG